MCYFCCVLGNHQALLVEPILLPEDLSHLNIDKVSEASESETCFFYPNGKKKVNMSQVVDKVSHDRIEEMGRKADRYNATHKKKHHHVGDSMAGGNHTRQLHATKTPTGSVSSAPKPKQSLYHSRKRDVKTENLLNRLRFNEAKIVGLISTTT